MVDKETNHTAHYAKGHGDQYQDFCERHFPGKIRLPVIRVLGGERQDVAFEACLGLATNRPDIVTFLIDRLASNKNDNILQMSLFTVLECVEMIAQVRVGAIFFLAVIVPMRWLAGHTHNLAHRNWGEVSMGRALDAVYVAFKKVALDGSLLLNEDFIMNIFEPFYAELPKLKDHIDYYFEEKECNVIGSFRRIDRELAIDAARPEIFYLE